MNNCTLLQTTESMFCRKPFKASEPAVIDVTPVATAPSQTSPLSRSLVVPQGTTALVPATQVGTPALRPQAPIAFLQVKPKARRASKKSAAQSFVELMIAAASLLFLAMT